MPFETGREKTGGRKPNTPNRTTAQMRESLQNIFQNNLERLQQDLDNMSAYNRWQVLNGLLRFHLPTLTKNENTNAHEGEMKIVVEYVNPTKPAQPAP